MDLTVIVVIGPEGASDSIERTLIDQGVEGFTSWPVKGYGQHGRRPTQWVTGNMRIEALVPDEVAMRVLEAIRTKFPREHGVFAYAMGNAKV